MFRANSFSEEKLIRFSVIGNGSRKAGSEREIFRCQAFKSNLLSFSVLVTCAFGALCSSVNLLYI